MNLKITYRGAFIITKLQEELNDEAWGAPHRWKLKRDGVERLHDTLLNKADFSETSNKRKGHGKYCIVLGIGRSAREPAAAGSIELCRQSTVPFIASAGSRKMRGSTRA
jgi:hypothetical protein